MAKRASKKKASSKQTAVPTQKTKRRIDQYDHKDTHRRRAKGARLSQLVRRQQSRNVPTVLLLSVLLPSFVFAWGGDGHQIICLIAEARLKPEAMAAIHELLGEDVNISDADVASWADEIRRERRETASWHYVNIPADADAFDPNRDGKNGDNISCKSGVGRQDQA